MTTDIDWINIIIRDLVNQDCKLSDTILKVKIIANKLKNEKLKDWVDNEINGYIGKDVPEYRLVHVGIFGNLLQDRGFGGFASRNDVPLPTECLADEIKEIEQVCIQELNAKGESIVPEKIKTMIEERVKSIKVSKPS